MLLIMVYNELCIVVAVPRLHLLFVEVSITFRIDSGDCFSAGEIARRTCACLSEEIDASRRNKDLVRMSHYQLMVQKSPSLIPLGEFNPGH